MTRPRRAIRGQAAVLSAGNVHRDSGRLHSYATFPNHEMSKKRCIPPMVLKNFHRRATLSKTILGRVSPRPAENKTGGLVGLEDSTAPYDTTYGHLQQAPSIVIQTDSIVAQSLPMSLNQSCASSANVGQQCCASVLNHQYRKTSVFRQCCAETSIVAQRFQK